MRTRRQWKVYRLLEAYPATTGRGFMFIGAASGRGIVMDESEREEFYTSASNDGDDGDDYELEPPDAEVLAAEERRAQEAIADTQMSVDIDEIYRDLDRERGREILEGWVRDFRFRFRFQVKHLLIGTALLAIVLTLAKLEMLFTSVVLLIMVSVAGLFFYLQWQERKQQEEAARRRAEMYERRRAYFERKLRPTGAAEGAAARGERSAASAMSNALEDAFQQAKVRPQFRFHFSLLQLMAAMTVAAVIFAMIRVLGGPSQAATVLGFVALLGLVIHAIGFELPSIVVLGWWLVLVLYVLLSIFAAVFGFA